MEHKFEIRQMFDDDFKRKVIEEYLLTGCTKLELQRKYNIRFKSAISTWMQRMGYLENYKAPSLKFSNTKRILLPANDKKSKKELDLQKRIEDLERQLEDEKLRSEAFVRIIEKAEKELKIPIRKKPFTK
jgi:transposase